MARLGATGVRSGRRMAAVATVEPLSRYRGTYADPRPDELERRLANEAERQAGYIARCLEDEDARERRGETRNDHRCRPKADRVDDNRA